jgi:hypothetical protein
VPQEIAFIQSIKMSSISDYDNILLFNIFCDPEDIEMNDDDNNEIEPSGKVYVTNCPDVREYAGSLENFDERNKAFISVIKSLFPGVTRIECVSSIGDDVDLDAATCVISWEFIKFE